MTSRAQCNRCGSADIIPRARVADRDGGGWYDLQIEVRRRPNALIFKGAQRSSVVAQVCGACGYVELFVETPGTIYDAYVRADAGPDVSAAEELERTREALADSQIQLHDLEKKLEFLETLLAGREPSKALPEPDRERPDPASRTDPESV